MEWIKNNWRALALAAAVLIAAYFLLLANNSAQAADLGGNCCADLEERIAELEATTARKGNKKVSLRIYGQVNKALMHASDDSESDAFVIENSSAESFFGVAGEATINPGWKAGYVLEIGVGGYGDGEDILGGPDNANGLYTRRAFWFIDGPAGKGSLGLQSQATDGIVETSTANTNVVARMLSLRPVNGPQAGEALDIFDGARDELARYDSPLMFGGLVVSASWANGSFGSADVWDVAARYRGESGGFRYAAGLGYRDGVSIPSIGSFGDAVPFVGVSDVKVLSGSASVMHMATGLFVNAAYGRADVAGGSFAQWHAQGGVERAWNPLGMTTLYGEYSKSEDLDGQLYGAGIVQRIDAAEMDLYLSLRRIELNPIEENDDGVTLIMGGARVQF